MVEDNLKDNIDAKDDIEKNIKDKDKIYNLHPDAVCQVLSLHYPWECFWVVVVANTGTRTGQQTTKLVMESGFPN